MFRWLGAITVFLFPQLALGLGLGVNIGTAYDLLIPTQDNAASSLQAYQGFGAGFLLHVFFGDSKLIRPFAGLGVRVVDITRRSAGTGTTETARITQTMAPLEIGINISPTEKAGLDLIANADAGFGGTYSLSSHVDNILTTTGPTDEKVTSKISGAYRLCGGARILWEARPYIQGGLEVTRVFLARINVTDTGEVLKFKGIRIALSANIRN